MYFWYSFIGVKYFGRIFKKVVILFVFGEKDCVRGVEWRYVRFAWDYRARFLFFEFVYKIVFILNNGSDNN